MPRKFRGFNLPTPPTPLLNDTDSPSSPRSPIIPIRPKPTSPLPVEQRSRTYSQSSTSFSTSSRSTLVPPARLHLRSLIPPLFSGLANNPPPTPYPWSWTCHLCHSLYNLGVTRRCLNDGHYFCSQVVPPTIPDEGPETIFSIIEDQGARTAEEVKRLVRKPKQKKAERRRIRRTKSCNALFDYTAWERFNFWRRETRILRNSENISHFVLPLDSTHRRRLEAEIPRSQDGSPRDCWRNCDFPSACRDQRKDQRYLTGEASLTEGIGRPEEAEGARVETERMEKNTEKWKQQWEARIHAAENIRPGDREAEARLILDLFTGDIPGESSDFGELSAIRDNFEKKGTVSDGMGPLGVDCDGLGEELDQFQSMRSWRKTSATATDDGSERPKSPLKAEFIFKSALDSDVQEHTGNLGDEFERMMDIDLEEVQSPTQESLA